MNFRIITWIVGFIVLIYHLKQGYRLSPDSLGYIDAVPIRSSGYSLIVLFFQKLFHGYALKALHIFQISFLFLSIQYFLNFLKKYFQLADFVVFAISFLFYFYMYRFGNIIGSEPIAYGLFLFVVKFLVQHIIEKNIKSFVILCAILCFLVLIRAQFYFFYPLVLLIILIGFFIDRKRVIFLKNLFIFLFFIFFANIIDKTYHYIRHDRFVGTPYTGLQLVTDALYIAKEGDSIVFSNQYERIMFKKIYEDISEKNLTLESILTVKPNLEKSELIFHYTHSYNDICHRNTKLIVGSYFSDPQSIDYWINIDKVTLAMALKIIKKHPLDFMKLYMNDILRNGFLSNVFLIFFLIVLVFSLITIVNNPNNKNFIFLGVSSIMVILNFFLVALVEPILDRYAYYTSIIYFTSLFIVISKTNFIEKEKMNP